jgi:hypothetical protein
MKKDFESSLKAIEIENAIDLYFYRPAGYAIARLLRHTPVSPNMITILSIFVGSAAAYLFYFNRWNYNLAGIAILIFANMLDCADGQLARLTGRKSEIGRILDGMAGDIWFILIYVSFALQLKHIHGTGWFFLPAVLSGLSHLVQANITDYYKTVHLYFMSREKGRDFHSTGQVRARQKKQQRGLYRFFYILYEGYTHLQEYLTPSLQQLLHTLEGKYGEAIPEHVRQNFRRDSLRLMKRSIDLLTFNGRMVILFAVVLSGHEWIYFIYEGVILNLVLIYSINRHEAICRRILHSAPEVP